MNVAGSNGGGVANKYRDKSLRVVAVDTNGQQKEESEKKWKNAGADFYLYDKDMNCLEPYYKTGYGYPYNIAIKNGKKTEIDETEESIKNIFGF